MAREKMASRTTHLCNQLKGPAHGINSTYVQLTQRVKELEARLSPTTAEAVAEPSPNPTEAVTMDDETSVDALATNAFDEVPQRDIGYFGETGRLALRAAPYSPYQGPTSNHALFRALSSAFAFRVPLIFQSQQHSAESSAREHFIHPSLSSPSALPQSPPRQTDGRPKSVDPYALPSDQDLLGLVNQFFATVGIVLPYVDKSFLLHDGTQLGQRAIWQSSKPGRALLNIICAHAAFTLRSTNAEVFYRRTLLILDELTLRGSSLELGMGLTTIYLATHTIGD